MITYGNGLVGFILTFISLINASFAIIISFIVILTVIYHQYHNLLIEINIETLIGDVYGNNFDSSLCVFRGYFIASIGCAVYHAFMTQGLFHLCRVVYANYRWLQLYWFYIVIGPVQFIRQHSNNQTDIVKQRQHRHLLAIRRMFISISILLALGLPAVVLVIMFFITNVESPLVHRIVWMGAEVGGAVLSVQMVLMTPQLKTIFASRWQQNRVVPAARPLQIRVPATVE
ncbi:unnamed protein product [Adineta steineri]|uniref:Uncharacterized protein n=1 Tax=Adineta steineri TaxID=433720 RepID=A0A819HP89_9BILA|nr:unnamed protein product [Adineta steineri]